MQDTGHPEPDDRHPGGAPGRDVADPATVNHDPASPTWPGDPASRTWPGDPASAPWPGVADIPSPQAERVAPWSAQHLSSPGGSSSWFSPGDQTLAGQESPTAADPVSTPPANGPDPASPRSEQTDARWSTAGTRHRAWPVRSPQTPPAEQQDEPAAEPPEADASASSHEDAAGGWSSPAEPGWAAPTWSGEPQQSWRAEQQPWPTNTSSWPAQQPEEQPAWQTESPPWPPVAGDDQYPVDQPTGQVPSPQGHGSPWDEQRPEQQQSWPQPEPQQAWPQRPDQQPTWPPTVWAPGQHPVEPPAGAAAAGWQPTPQGGPAAHPGQVESHGRPGPRHPQHPQHPQQPPYPVAHQAPGQSHGYAPPQPAQPMAGPPTAEEFAARRAHRPQAPEATMGVPALVRKVSFGMVSPAPSRKEREYRDAVTKVRRNFGGLRQITVVNPKGGAGKTVAALMIAMTFGQSRGGYVLAWDNNETQGTLGMRAQQDFHVRTVRDVLHDLDTFMGPHGKVGDLSSYVRSQGEAMFDVLASDESATAGEMLTAQAFRAIREVVDRFYKLIIVDTGNNVRAENWQAAIDATNQLVVTMSARGDSAETAARMLDHLEQTGRDQLVRQAVSVVAMPASRKGVDLPAIERHFAARTRAVLVAPYEPLLDSGEPIRYGELSQQTREAWLKISAHIAEGL